MLDLCLKICCIQFFVTICQPIAEISPFSRWCINILSIDILTLFDQQFKLELIPLDVSQQINKKALMKQLSTKN